MKLGYAATLALLAGSLALFGARAAGPDAHSVEEKGKAELSRAVDSLRPRPSFDTTPVEFTLAGIRYRVPRNYIFQKASSMVSIRINLVDSSPLTPDNAWCLDKGDIPNWHRSPGCEPFTFFIQGLGQPADTSLANMMPVIQNKEPIKGPFGFDLYGVGQGEPGIKTAGGELYRKGEQNFVALYWCQPFDNHGVRDGVCNTESDPLPSGSHVFFFFSLRQLAEIADIEGRIRRIAESFTVQEGNDK